MTNNTIKVDFSDLEGMRDLMRRHEEFHEALVGQTDEGERTLTHINEDHIILEVYQNNHWIRMSYLWDDGTREDVYTGKW